ncbi:MAG: glycosyl transferase family 2 [Candidatus Omnitrophica bacterium CG08_land_8_20_14_0_20_41_16]|uniref:Glycosyl transferase family 2 n=1 Tax=Candidatus Sherwoodlollariibacterium unditelluris TaxID=1974757 RepID=A0A2G9YKX9_9BACT|nr:MAG: glycosyl transferase family 2 [Candidatus Omnitrophica bacterium CG23_combo_of_CG06-09_8_20_14_all_41_10]PIS33402.1 MAG: glycosyl transferase family 2 [Candidatus Omnitrophica bacterium CG08_land_8_20_14_0_20_41_16]
MLEGKRVIVVMPAYNAGQTLEQTYRDIPKGIVDDVLVVDDHSHDQTVEIVRSLGLKLFVHDKNKGYGANQKTCYQEALKMGADIVVMLHPDYQYPPKLIVAMAALVSSGMFDVVLGSRILGGTALRGGMPLYKYISNRLLTFFQNIISKEKLSEYHTGYRAFSREALSSLPLLENSDDFIFDNQIIAQALYFGYNIGEITAPSHYTQYSSSVSFRRSVVYGLGVVWTSIKFFLQKNNLAKFDIFNKNGRKIGI